MELYIFIGLGVCFYVWLKRDNQKVYFKKVEEANRVCSYMNMGEVIFRIAQVQSRLKEMGILTEKERIILEALELRRMELKDSSTPESIARELEEFANVYQYRNFE